MTYELKSKLIEAAKANISTVNDSSHDILHTLRVLVNAEHIAKIEGADLDVVIPAALFHDLIVYPKDSEKSKNSSSDSAILAEKILKEIPEFPREKIAKVKEVILATSFRYGVETDGIEAEIVNDADLLEATGLIGAMRTFGSCGSMNRPFYNADDPFGKNREYDEMSYGLDHFYQRLLIAKDRVKTNSAKAIAERRTKELQKFLEELEKELKGE